MKIPSWFLPSVLATVLIIAGMSHCQLPRPYVQGGVSLNGTSESTLSGNVSGGFDYEGKHSLSDVSARYDTVHKDAPGISPKSEGHQRAVLGTAFYRRHSWAYGVGGEFEQFAITEYTKQAAYAFAGASKDFDTDARIQVMYFKAFNERTRYPDAPGCACTNGVNGIRFQMYLPSPASKSHWFGVIDLEPYWFHTTVVDPSDPVLTRLDESQHHIDSKLKFDIRYRF